MVIGVSGCCRRKELTDLTMQNVKEVDNVLLITIPYTKTYVERSFTVVGEFYNICKRYLDLRLKVEATSDRLFLTLRGGKFINIPVGIHTVGSIPKVVASFLKLPEPERYTSHCIRRTSATIYVEAGASESQLLSFGKWKSSSAARGYYEQSMRNKTTVGNTITNAIVGASSNFAVVSNTSSTSGEVSNTIAITAAQMPTPMNTVSCVPTLVSNHSSRTFGSASDEFIPDNSRLDTLEHLPHNFEDSGFPDSSNSDDSFTNGLVPQSCTSNALIFNTVKSISFPPTRNTFLGTSVTSGLQYTHASAPHTISVATTSASSGVSMNSTITAFTPSAPALLSLGQPATTISSTSTLISSSNSALHSPRPLTSAPISDSHSTYISDDSRLNLTNDGYDSSRNIMRNSNFRAPSSIKEQSRTHRAAVQSFYQKEQSNLPGASACTMNNARSVQQHGQSVQQQDHLVNDSREVSEAATDFKVGNATFKFYNCNVSITVMAEK